MSKLFGIPIETVLLVLLAALGAALGFVAMLAARNRVFFRLGVRNVRRRPGRTALIVAGSMLGTTIIAAALATGDTMSQTIRSSAVAGLGRADEVVAARGVEAPLAPDSTGATGVRYFPQRDAARIARAAAPSGLVDGVAPVIVEPVAVQDLTSRQNEPRVALFAGEARSLEAFGPMRGQRGTVSLANLAPHEVFPQREGRLEPRRPERRFPAHSRRARREVVRVKDIVRYHGGGTADEGLLMPLAPAQRLLGKPGLVKLVFVANHGGPGATERVIASLSPCSRVSASRPTTASRTPSRRQTSRERRSCPCSRRSARSRSPRASC